MQLTPQTNDNIIMHYSTILQPWWLVQRIDASPLAPTVLFMLTIVPLAIP